MRNEAAIRILLKGYWGTAGWKEPDFSQAEVLMLTESGYLKKGARLTHDECLAWAFEVRGKVSRSQVANAFLYSLTSRHLEFRSALGSYAHLEHMPNHKFERAEGFHSDFCLVCGYETSAGREQNFGVLNFERHKWGGVRHDQLAYMAYDLECFSNLEAVTPTAEDTAILVRILKLAGECQNVGQFKKGLAKIVSSNDAERAQLCEILAYAGILQPLDCPSFAGSYVPWDKRGDGKPRSDQKFPLSWWEGNGYNLAAAIYWFPQLANEI